MAEEVAEKSTGGKKVFRKILFVLLLFLLALTYHEYTVYAVLQDLQKNDMSFNGSGPFYFPEGQEDAELRFKELLLDLDELRKRINNGENSKELTKAMKVNRTSMRAILYPDGKDIRLSTFEKMAEVQRRSFFPFLHGADFFDQPVQEAQETVIALTMALKLHKVANKGYPQPNEGQSFIFDLSGMTPGLVNIFMDTQGLKLPNMQYDYDGKLLDPWGDPYVYVLGDYQNRILGNENHNGLPQDTNRPADFPDWNAADEGKFPYVFSYGGGDANTPETWIYVRY